MNPWQFLLLEACFKYGAEPAQDNGKILIISPKELGKTEQTQIRSIIPEGFPVEFKTGPRMSTIIQIKQLLASVGAQGDFRSDSPKAVFEVSGIDTLHPVWKDVNRLVQRDGYFTSWTIKADGSEITVNPLVLKALESHKDVRGLGISKDDISDLNILLNASTSVEDFLSKI
jgi:hypothetical protein